MMGFIIGFVSGAVAVALYWRLSLALDRIIFEDEEVHP